MDLTNNKPNDVRVVPVELLERVESSLRVPDGCPPEIWKEVERTVNGYRAELLALLAQPADQQGEPVALTVWYGAMPESNGKSNFTAILHRKGSCISEGICIDRSEYPERTRYEAERMLFLIGEREEEPDILAYDADIHSGYVRPVQPATAKVDDALRDKLHELLSAVRSINHSPRSEVRMIGDDEPCYAQRKEWVHWLLSICDEAEEVAKLNTPQ